ncbi:MAG: hypothetical protein HBSAPP04_20520 [Ignavibacteriaceae bacterium]|nr:MAG: hypothetical protein HBSAPP04_20520 [Ignavibacteriaceae bacterium]
MDLKSRTKLIEKVLLDGTISNLDAELKRKNGEIRNCLISSTIIKSDGRNVMLSVVKDITPIKQFEEEVKRSEEKYRLLTETTPDFVLMHDTEGTIRYVNSSALNVLGYSQDELIGQHIALLSTKKNLSDAYARREKRLSGEFGIMQYNLEVVKKDGTTFPVEVRSAPIIRNGVPDSFVLVARDITEQLRQLDELLKTKEAAEQMNLLKSHFFANMSHELRTPFVGILGYAQILLETVSDPENLAMVENILNGAKRLTDTLDKILSLAQLDFNEIEITSEEIGVNNIVRDVISNHDPEAALKHIKLKFEPLREEPSVFCDRKILNSILDKLISNAVKYSEKGTVEVIAEVVEQDCRKGKLVVSVKDEGMGIETEKQDIIWLPFRQASEGRGRSFEGTGLGLSITRRFVELLGGEISLISKPGAGSVFSFVIPVEIPGKTNTIIA